MALVMQPVNSSNVAQIGYDAATKRLQVQFNNGGVYTYADVPASTYQAILQAPSIGRALRDELSGFDFEKQDGSND